MNSTTTHTESDRSALAFTLPSVFIILSYSVAFISFGGDCLSRVPLFFITAPFLLLASIAGVPAIRHSHFSFWQRLLLFACHILAAVFALLPFIGLLTLLFFLGGPINPG